MLFLRPSFVAQADVMNVVGVVFWSAVTIAMIVGAYVGYGYLKAWMSEPDEAPAAGFGLSDLRALHKEGKLTDEEYERARQKMVSAAKAITDRLPPVIPKDRRSGGSPPTIPPGAGNVRPPNLPPSGP